MTKGKRPDSRILEPSISVGSSYQIDSLADLYPELVELNTLPFDFCEIQTNGKIDILINHNINFKMLMAGVKRIKHTINAIKITNLDNRTVDVVITLIQTGV